MTVTENTSGELDVSVLIVEDEPAIGRMLLRALAASGMSAHLASTGSEALELKARHLPTIVLLDLGLPDMNGVDLIPRLAESGDCGVIVLTGSGEETQRAAGLELGADDYIVKPPPLRELVARIKAVHRRVARGRPVNGNNAGSRRRLGATEVDFSRRIVRLPTGSEIHLTGAEAKVLEMLAAAGGEPVSRDALCRDALRRPLGIDDRSVDQLIVSLRKKLDGSGPPIMSIRGAGYALPA